MKLLSFLTIAALASAATANAEDLFIIDQINLSQSEVPGNFDPNNPFQYEGWVEGWLGGERVAIEGNLAAISARGYEDDSGETVGAVFTYEKVNGEWIFRQRIEGGPGLDGPLEFGSAIAIDNGVLFVGSPNFYGGANGEQVGLVLPYIWQDATKDWRQGLALNLSSEEDALGSNIAVHGMKIAVAGERGTAVHVYDMPTATTASQRIPRPAGVTRFGEHDVSGHTLAIDDTRLIVASPLDPTTAGNGLGTVSCYELINGNYVWQQNLVSPSPGQQQVFGYCIAMHGDLLVVHGLHSAGSDNRGVLHLYNYTPGAGWASDITLTHSQAGNFSLLGKEGIVFSDDGKTIIASGRVNDNSLRPGYFSFVLGDNGWVEGPTYYNPFGSTGGALGISGNDMILGTLNFGAEFYGHNPTNGVPVAFANRLRGLLYHEDAAASPYYATEKAVFRFLVNGYTVDNNTQMTRNASTDPVSDFFGPDEEARYEETLAIVRQRLGTQLLQSNWDALNNLYLDMIYNRAQVEILRAHESIADLDQNRLEAPAVVNGDLENVIDREIAAYTATDGALSYLENAIHILRTPLSDYCDNFSINPPVGYIKYFGGQPFRPLEAPQFLEGGVLTPVKDASGTPMTGDILPGHKDAVLLFETLAEYGRIASELAYLHLLNDDKPAATAVLRKARELAFFQGNPVRERLRNQEGEDPPVLREALLEWEQAVADLTNVEDEFATGLNPLGFDPNFLVILRDRKAGEENIDDTFDVLEARLADNGSETNLLKNARDARSTALALYDTYSFNVSEIASQLGSIDSDAEDRLLEIVGLTPGDAGYDQIPGPNNTADGGFVTGSELWDQYQNIKRARLQIARNSSEIANLEEKVRIETERNLFEVAQQNAIKSIRIDYGNQQASLEEELGQLRAAQAYSDVLANSLNPANWGEVIGNALNAGVQIYGELRQGEIAAEQQRLAASEEAAVIDAQNRILNANSAALIKTWMLDMKVLVLNSRENAIVLQQETGRLIALLREKKNLERRIETNDPNLVNRYFADPVHRTRFLSQTFLAHRLFEETQRYLFLMARALSYKMSRPFEDVMTGTGYTMSSIYKARNAFELDLIFQAMVTANNNNIGYDYPEDTFSLKQDAFGYVENGGTYSDPQTGQQVSATEAFRSLLTSPGIISGDLATDSFVQAVLTFSTVRDPLNTFHGADFFRGSRLTQINSSTGDVELINPNTPSNAGSYLDKIVELAVTIPGNHTTGAVETNIGITYRGTSVVRTKNLGRYERFDPNDPFSDFRLDRLLDESVSIPVRASTFEDNVWKTNDFLTASPGARLTANNAPGEPVEPPESYFTSNFRERSVAATSWQIAITLKDPQLIVDPAKIDDIIIHFRHKSSARQGDGN